jgi:hypothetical protein
VKPRTADDRAMAAATPETDHIATSTSQYSAAADARKVQRRKSVLD